MFKYEVRRGDNRLWYVYCEGVKLRGAHDSEAAADREVRSLRRWVPHTGGLSKRDLERLGRA